ncbi:MAG: hypothetical protein ACD_5C00226G0001 [uncultured bacterium]|nr:MAG: hypothetical protein ACD_5C00226G0001 [uncultured bacterium]
MENLHCSVVEQADVSLEEEGTFELFPYDSQTNLSRASKKAGEQRELELMLEHPAYFRQTRQ